MGQLIKIEVSFPNKALTVLAKAGCETFESIVSPLTKATIGVGKLIEDYFDRQLNSVQKKFAAECTARANQKILESQGQPRNSNRIKPIVFYLVYDSLENQADEFQLEVLSNVLANEVKSGEVHPEIVRILSRLTNTDLVLLWDIVNNQNKLFISRLFKSFKEASENYMAPNENSFNHQFLKDLGLITFKDRQWMTTYYGVEVIKIATFEGEN